MRASATHARLAERGIPMVLTRTPRLVLAAALRVVCLPRFSSAARPFTTEDAGTAGSRVTELEAALDMTHESACSGFALSRGLNGRLDVGLAFCLEHRDGGSAYDGAEASFKLALWPEHVALAGVATLNAPGRGLALAWSQGLGALQLDASLGSFLELGGNAHGEWGLALSGAKGSIGMGAELHGLQDEAATWLVGLTAPMGALALDVGLGGGFHPGRDLTVVAGMTLPLNPR
jgi:hypothetical protein